jgi:hypothetical protein
MARLISNALLFVVKITPWVLKLVWDSLDIVLTTLKVIFQGVFPQCEKKAIYWTQEVIRSGDLLNIWAKYIYPVMYFFALLTLLIGWGIHAWLVVKVIHLVIQWVFG